MKVDAVREATGQVRRRFPRIRMTFVNAIARATGPPIPSPETALSNCTATKMRAAVFVQRGNRDDDEMWIMAGCLFAGKRLCDDGQNFRVHAGFRRARAASRPPAPIITQCMHLPSLETSRKPQLPWRSGAKHPASHSARHSAHPAGRGRRRSRVAGIRSRPRTWNNTWGYLVMCPAR